MVFSAFSASLPLLETRRAPNCVILRAASSQSSPELSNWHSSNRIFRDSDVSGFLRFSGFFSDFRDFRIFGKFLSLGSWALGLWEWKSDFSGFSDFFSDFRKISVLRLLGLELWGMEDFSGFC